MKVHTCDDYLQEMSTDDRAGFPVPEFIIDLGSVILDRDNSDQRLDSSEQQVENRDALQYCGELVICPVSPENLVKCVAVY
jgi:hypothetical protein